MLSTEESAGTLLASAARTADAYSPEMNNNGRYKGVILFFDVTVDGAAASVEAIIEMLNPATKEWETYRDGGPTLDATGESQWILHPTPGIGGELPLTEEHAIPLPTIWRLFMDAADADSLTYSVGYQYLP